VRRFCHRYKASFKNDGSLFLSMQQAVPLFAFSKRLRVCHVVVVDPRTIADEATFASPRSPTKGIEHVFVNGEAIVRNGQPLPSESDRMPGRFLRFGK